MKTRHFERARTQLPLALRASLILTGALLVVLALLVDTFGYGDSGGLGAGQLLLILLGLAILLIGLLGKRIVAVHRGVAILLLNTLIVFATLELAAITIARSYLRFRSAETRALPYYADQDWSELYWSEAKQAEKYRYKPYVGWTHLPFKGATLTINEEGFRDTPGSDCVEGSYRLFAFGGSTMLGWGSQDSGTIPVYLQSGLSKFEQRPVCTINLADDGFVSTQSLIELVLHLRSGDIPDAVIFLDGINEVQAAYESGRPGDHVNLEQIAARFERREHPLLRFYKNSRQYALVRDLFDRIGIRGLGKHPRKLDTGSLAREVADVILGNYSFVAALADAFGFECYFFLQPHLALSRKPLTQNEEIFRSRIQPELADLAEKIYDIVCSSRKDNKHLWCLTDALDEAEDQLFIDPVGHLTPEGNRMVAKRILEAIRQTQIMK